MSDRVREAVSVFMDGEADELSVRRLVVQEDTELVRSTWASFHRQRRVLQGADLRFEPMDVSLSVMAALNAEPAYSERGQRAWLKPVAGLAVAASVAAIVVVGAPDWRQAGQAGNVTATTIAATTTESSATQQLAVVSVASPSSASLVADTSPDIRLAESVYLDNSDVTTAPILQFPQRHFSQSFNGGGGIPVSLQMGNAAQADTPSSFIYSMPARKATAAQYPDIRINGMSHQPILYVPVSRSAYSAEFMLPARQ